MLLPVSIISKKPCFFNNCWNFYCFFKKVKNYISFLRKKRAKIVKDKLEFI